MKWVATLCVFAALAAMLYTGMVQVVVLSTEVYVAKAEAKRHIQATQDYLTLTISTVDIQSGKVIITDEREVKYQGHLYDIATIEQLGDSMVLKVLRDEHEENLLAAISEHINQLITGIPYSNKHGKTSVKIVKPDFFCQQVMAHSLSDGNTLSFQSYATTPVVCISHQDIHSPPPEA